MLLPLLRARIKFGKLFLVLEKIPLQFFLDGVQLIQEKVVFRLGLLQFVLFFCKLVGNGFFFRLKLLKLPLEPVPLFRTLGREFLGLCEFIFRRRMPLLGGLPLFPGALQLALQLRKPSTKPFAGHTVL